MKRSGKIKQYGIFWGSCSGHGCLQSSVHPLMFSKGVDDAKSINKFDIFDFPTAKIPDNVLKSYAVPPPMHFGFHIIERCNAALSQGKTIHDSHSFTMAIPVTLGFDTGITKDKYDQAVSGDGPHPLNDVDHSKTVNVVLDVVCEPAPETVKAPPKILEAQLGVTTSGNTCPKPSTARVIIAAEAPRAVFYKIERADGTTTTADWIQGEIKIQNDLMGGKSPWMHAEHALDKLDPGSSKFRLWIDGWGKTPWRTVNIACPPFEVISAWLKYDVEDKATCSKKVVETATFYATRPGMVPYEIKHQGGLVVHSGQVQAKRQGDQYIAIATRNLTIKEPFKADMMADVKNSPANSGWVPLKVDCLEPLSGKLTLQSLGATSCKGEALVAIHTNGAGEMPYELECGPGKSWQRKVTAMANKIGVDKVRFDVANTEQITCVLRTRIDGVLKPLDGGSKTFQCHKPTDAGTSNDLVPETRPEDPPVLDTLTGDFSFVDNGDTKCPRQGKALVNFKTSKPDNVHWSLDCTNGHFSGVAQTAPSPKGGFIAPALVSFDINQTTDAKCALKTVAPGKPKVHTLKGHTFQCVRTTGVSGADDLAPEARPDPQKPDKPGKVVDPVKPDKPGTAVVDPPRPTISCANGKVKDGACDCEPHFKPVKAGKNAWRCVRSVADPKPKKPIVSEPQILCVKGTMKSGACTCARAEKVVKTGKNAWSCVKVGLPRNKDKAKIEVKIAPKKMAAPKLGKSEKAKGDKAKGKGKTAKKGNRSSAIR